MRDVAAGGWAAQVSLRALQTNFIAPIGAGRLTVSVHVLREGKSVRQVQATVTQRDEVAALMVGVFGSDRETTVPALLPTRPPTAKEVDDIKPVSIVAVAVRTSRPTWTCAGETARRRSPASTHGTPIFICVCSIPMQRPCRRS